MCCQAASPCDREREECPEIPTGVSDTEFSEAPKHHQYLGTHINDPTSCQVLLMELMEESLTSSLERSTPPLPFRIEVNLCCDISLAVAYLHSNDIIHRDLSSNNVYLTADKRAKVTDFGMSRLADSSARLSTLTQTAGCYVYMSPEALAHTPKYSKAAKGIRPD